MVFCLTVSEKKTFWIAESFFLRGFSGLRPAGPQGPKNTFRAPTFFFLGGLWAS